MIKKLLVSVNYKQSKGRIEMEVFFKEPLVVKRRPTHMKIWLIIVMVPHSFYSWYYYVAD